MADEIDTNLPDNTSGLITPAVMRTTLHAMENVLNVKLNYGAVGDGVTDDTAAIQAAINAAQIIGGNSPAVFFPAPANYKVKNLYIGPVSGTGTGTQGLALLGDYSGNGASILSFSGPANTPLLTISNSTGIHVERLGLDGNNIVGSIGIFVQWDGASNFDPVQNFFRDLEIRRFDTGIHNGNGNNLSTDSQYYDAIEIDNCLSYAVYLNSTEGQMQIFRNCRFNGNPYGIYCNAGTPYAYSCIFTLNANADIFIGNTITAAIIEGCYTEQSGYFLDTGGPSGVVNPVSLIGNALAGTGTIQSPYATASVVSISRTSGVSTVTLSAPVNVANGDLVTITGVTDSSFDVTNGIVTGHPSNPRSGQSSFSYQNAGANTSSSGGTVTFQQRIAIRYRLGGPLTLIGNQMGTRFSPQQIQSGAGANTNLQITSFGNLWWDVDSPFNAISSLVNTTIHNDVFFSSVTNATTYTSRQNSLNDYDNNGFTMLRTNAQNTGADAANSIVWGTGTEATQITLWTLGNNFGGAAHNFFLFDNTTHNSVFSVDSTDIFHVRRPAADLGTALTSGAFALSGSWGSTASILVASNSFDTRGEITVTANGTGITANPTVTLTFADGTWGNAPFAIVEGNDANSVGKVTWTSSATQLVLTFNATPSGGTSYNFCWMVRG